MTHCQTLNYAFEHSLKLESYPGANSSHDNIDISYSLQEFLKVFYHWILMIRTEYY